MNRLSALAAVALLLTGLTAALAADTGPAGPPRSNVWGPWQVLPWDGEPVADTAWAEALNRPLDLTRKGQPGEQRRYQVRRINLQVDREGRVLNRMVTEAQLHRVLVEEVQPGLWRERCTWERFAAGQGLGPGDYPTPQDIPLGEGIAFDFSPDTFDYVNPGADFSSAGGELTGYLLKVLTMDAMGAEALVLAARSELGPSPRIGDTFRHSQWEPWDITRVGEGDGAVGRYQLGEMQVSIAGLTRWRGEPAVLIWFSGEGNEVTQEVETPEFAMNMHGIEYFRGQLAASLVNGRVLAMDLWGPLPCRMEMSFGGVAQEVPIAGFVQQVSLWEVPPATAP